MTLGSRDVYFHRNRVLRPPFEHPQVGQEVRFDEEMGENGAQATTVRLVGSGTTSSVERTRAAEHP